ncbi:MAG: hypothetical protein CL867_00325 [Cytophagaceae bacterium]|nr:hypothetical protein [Cytophagaceae bacterium]
MNTKQKVLIGSILFLFAVLIYLESTEKEPVNWFPSYSKSDKIPLGTYVAYQSLKETLDVPINDISVPPYQFLADSSEAITGNYIFINSSIDFDEAEADRLLDWVSSGNTLFVAGSGIGSRILDTLHLETTYYYDLDNLYTNPIVSLSNPNLQKRKSYYLDIETNASYFSEIDTLNTIVLGQFDLSKEDTVNIEEPKIHFIKQDFGQGDIVIHLMPELFTNYNLLRADNIDYLAAAFSYLDTDRTMYWDRHYINAKSIQTSPLYVFLKNRYMKWAYYMLILGLILWVIFEGKRKQRAIPIVTPLPNKTLEFTETIAGMYLERKDHRSIATYQINYFFDYLRTELLIATGQRDAAFIERLHLKSGKSQEETKRLFDFIEMILASNTVTQEQLERLNKLIEAFKNK